LVMTIDTILRAARQNVKPALVLDPLEPELYELEGKRLVVATVPLSRGPVYQSGGVFWGETRDPGTHTVPLDASELLEIIVTGHKDSPHRRTFASVEICKTLVSRHFCVFDRITPGFALSDRLRLTSAV
jgi:hypothetical protein